jgi:phosphatidylserine/phosphatidylglycerophosphate/cardiolipin synthase-like enzyme
MQAIQEGIHVEIHNPRPRGISTCVRVFSEEGSVSVTGCESWFLSADERGNSATKIDRRRRDGRAWTEGNQVEPLVHGATYFRNLHEGLGDLDSGDWVHFTDWRGDPDECLAGPGTEIGKTLAELAAKGIHVRGLLWRSHPHLVKMSERENLRLVREINKAGGQVLLDERVRRGGSHHQKLVLLRRLNRKDSDVAFVGGIDLCHGRNDDAVHDGDPQVYEMNERYGERPPWHDVQLKVRGPALADLATTFRERWDDPTPLEHRSPWRRAIHRSAAHPRHPDPLPPMPRDPCSVGTHAVQVLRTYPAKRTPYPFAPEGERSVARAYRKALRRVRSLIFLEDQYLWSKDVASSIAEALTRSPELRLIAVVPRYPEQRGPSIHPELIGQEGAIETLKEAGGDRVAFYDLENARGTPIYVHSKVCVMDDVWAAVGSDNLNRRSWTHDSELSCSILDATLDQRGPQDPGGLGDGARRFARELRLELWREHLGRNSEELFFDPVKGFEAWQESAAALEAWHRHGRRRARPPGRARIHDPAGVPRWARLYARPAYRLLIDPDGRPADMRGTGHF